MQRDLDLLGFGDAEPGAMLATFREICGMPLDDGVVFDIEALHIDRVRDEEAYAGLRVVTNAILSGARIRVLIDVGFGDAVEPNIAELEFPVLLDLPPPRLRAYPREAVIAEKFEAMVALGRANSRMKDFYDIWALSRTYEFIGESLARAIAATFARRKTPIPAELPEALTPAFAGDPAKVQQWNAFVAPLTIQGTLPTIINDLAAFIMPHADRARQI